FGGVSPNFSMDHVETLYAPRPEMDGLLKKDGGEFRAALQRLFGAGTRADGSELIAPAERYLEEKVNGLTAAAELGQTNTERVRARFGSRQAVELGVPQLAADGAIRRDAWEDYFDQVVRALSLGEAVPSVDGLSRPDYQPQGAPFEMQVTLNKPARARGAKLLNVVVENKTGRAFFA